MSLLNRTQTSSSVTGSKVNTMDDARKRILAGLQGQIEIWNKDRGESLPATKAKGSNTPAKSSLWFKKKDLNNDYLLKIKLLQTNIYTSEQAKKSRQPYFTVSAEEMSKVMTDTHKEIAAGKWDDHIRMSLAGTKIGLLD